MPRMLACLRTSTVKFPLQLNETVIFSLRMSLDSQLRICTCLSRMIVDIFAEPDHLFYWLGTLFEILFELPKYFLALEDSCDV